MSSLPTAMHWSVKFSERQFGYVITFASSSKENLYQFGLYMQIHCCGWNDNLSSLTYHYSPCLWVWHLLTVKLRVKQDYFPGQFERAPQRFCRHTSCQPVSRFLDGHFYVIHIITYCDVVVVIDVGHQASIVQVRVAARMELAGTHTTVQRKNLVNLWTWKLEAWTLHFSQCASAIWLVVTSERERLCVYTYDLEWL